MLRPEHFGSRILRSQKALAIVWYRVFCRLCSFPCILHSDRDFLLSFCHLKMISYMKVTDYDIVAIKRSWSETQTSFGNRKLLVPEFLRKIYVYMPFFLGLVARPYFARLVRVGGLWGREGATQQPKLIFGCQILFKHDLPHNIESISKKI